MFRQNLGERAQIRRLIKLAIELVDLAADFTYLPSVTGREREAFVIDMQATLDRVRSITMMLGYFDELPENHLIE